MLVTIKDGFNRALLANKIEAEFENSRFSVQVVPVGKTRINIKNVRLRESKVYCGSHPYACDIEGGRKAKYLEGADWVEFNDRLNDVLDRWEVSAWVRSSVCEIRRGLDRRVEYDGRLTNEFVNEYTWYFSGDSHSEDAYQNYCGKIAPASEYPFGTPGEYLREVS